MSKSWAISLAPCTARIAYSLPKQELKRTDIRVVTRTLLDDIRRLAERTLWSTFSCEVQSVEMTRQVRTANQGSA